MKKWWLKFKQWHQSRRDNSRKVLFAEMLAKREPMLMSLVSALANDQALGMIRKYLDGRRILHCKFCLRTEQLRRIDGGYACPGHKEEMEKKAKEASCLK